MFDNSQMNGVNLRLASLKGACLRFCNLRYAVMACTDLEVHSHTSPSLSSLPSLPSLPSRGSLCHCQNCDLDSSDLQHANLRGANFVTTNLQDIVV